MWCNQARKPWNHPALYQQIRLLVVVQWCGAPTEECPSLCEWPSLYDHSVLIFWWLLWAGWFVDVYSNGLYNHHISIQSCTFEIWLSPIMDVVGVKLSYQHESKSLRSFFPALCWIFVRLFPRPKEVQPGHSKMYLMKSPWVYGV